MRDGIPYPFPNFNGATGATVEVGEWISNFILHFTRYEITHEIWLKLNHVSKRGPSDVFIKKDMITGLG